MERRLDTNKTLKEALQEFRLDKKEDIPWIIKLLENPLSPLALPGKISLFNHDCLHVLLDRKATASDEAFVIGFTMGNDPKTQPWHLKIFKFFSQYIYPHPYRFSRDNFSGFDLGFNYGKTFKTRFNILDFSQYQDAQIIWLRKVLGIDEKSLLKLRVIGNYYQYQKSISLRNKNNIQRSSFKLNNILRILSAIFCMIGGILLSSNTRDSGYGFIFLAVSSGTLLIASLLQRDKIMIFYSAMLFLFVDLRGIYFWLIA